VLEPAGEPIVERYWNLDFTPRRQPAREDEAAMQVRELLRAGVRRRLVADVPVGAFLSGGVDSTIVVGLMASLGRRVRTFSIAFAGDPDYDETAYARTAAQSFGTEHTEFAVKPSDFELVEKLVWHHDGPFGDSSAIPTYVVAQLTRQHVTVALNGDGGDELFAGYLRFWAGASAERVPRALRQLGALASHLMPAGMPERSLRGRARRFLSSAHMSLGDRLASWNSCFGFNLDAVLQPDLAAQAPVDRVLSFHRSFFAHANGMSPLALALAHNFHTYLPYDLNVKVDRTSMAHALETRSPFLDTALMEYVAGLPDDFKLRGRTSKYILRRAFADLLPPEIQRRGKMGFGIPLATWFRGDLKTYLLDHLAAPSARIRAYVRPEVAVELLDHHMSGRADHSHQLWALLTMELWLRNLPRLAQPWQA